MRGLPQSAHAPDLDPAATTNSAEETRAWLSSGNSAVLVGHAMLRWS